ncbi:hypothetical protein LZ30DRAFT_482157 [Colletotrichum cereale]|nr:hypothetical protein LZ30DRAFT_482157 [Colletotrichum cereale]
MLMLPHTPPSLVTGERVNARPGSRCNGIHVIRCLLPVFSDVYLSIRIIFVSLSLSLYLYLSLARYPSVLPPRPSSPRLPYHPATHPPPRQQSLCFAHFLSSLHHQVLVHCIALRLIAIATRSLSLSLSLSRSPHLHTSTPPLLVSSLPNPFP